MVNRKRVKWVRVATDPMGISHVPGTKFFCPICAMRAERK